MSFHNSLSSNASSSTDRDQSTVRIAVMGATGSGKTTFINQASGSNLRVRTGLGSCTAEVKPSDKFILDGRTVTLIDTPGFDDTSKSVTEVLQTVAAFLAVTYEQGFRLSGVIYIHRISDSQFGGIVGRNFNMLQNLCGDAALENAVLVTNMWGEVAPDIGGAREEELSRDFFKPALDEGAQMVRHQNTPESAQNIVRKIVNNHPVALRIQRELVDRRKYIVDTAAGKVISQELNEQIGRYQTQLREILEAMVEALKEKDEETMQELEDKGKLQERVEKIKKDLEGMAANYAAKKERMEAKVKELKQGAKGGERDEDDRTPSPQITSHVISNPSRLGGPSFLPISGQGGTNERRPTPTPRVRIVVMGATSSGKTTFINLASGSDLRVGTGLESCTANVEFANEFILDGKAVTLVDTPGFDDTTKNNTEILNIIAAFLATTYEKGSELSGVIYIHRVPGHRLDGIVGWNFDIFRKLCGGTALRNVVLLTNLWDEVSPDISKARDHELRNNSFKLAILKGARMIQHHNTAGSAHDIIRTIMVNPPVVLQIQRELVDEKKDILNTSAGEAIIKALNEQIRRHKTELEEARAETDQALGEEDEELRQELEEETRRLQEQIEKITKDSEGLVADYAAEKEEMKARVKEMEQEAEVREMQREAKVREMKRQARMREVEQKARMREAEQKAKIKRERAEAKRERQLDHAPRLQANTSVTGRRTPDQSRLDNLSNGYSVKISIEYQTRAFLRTDIVSTVKKELLEDTLSPNTFTKAKGVKLPRFTFNPGYKYVEVVMQGKTEGRFLHDPRVHHGGMMGQVSKLICRTREDMDREVQTIVSTWKLNSQKVPYPNQAKCYDRLHMARVARDELRNGSSRDISHPTRIAPSRQGSRHTAT